MPPGGSVGPAVGAVVATAMGDGRGVGEAVACEAVGAAVKVGGEAVGAGLDWHATRAIAMRLARTARPIERARPMRIRRSPRGTVTHRPRPFGPASSCRFGGRLLQVRESGIGLPQSGRTSTRGNSRAVGNLEVPP